MDWGHLLFGYRGRINRAKYLLAALIYVVALIVAAVAGYAIGGLAALIVAFVVVGIGCFVSGVMVGIERLHDRNKSGAWLLLFYVVPPILDRIGRPSGGDDFGILSIISLAISLWALVELGFLRGTIGPNDFGPDPLGPPVSAASSGPAMR
jgi:uncharacterized membrane protein YhaH (DUF805 family)